MNPAVVQPGWSVGGALVTSRASSRFAGTEAGFPVQGASSADPGRSAGIPFASYARYISPGVGVTASIDAPFGLATHYPDDWAGRYSATESSVQAGQVRVGVAFQASERVTVGAAVAVQRAEVQIGQAVDYGAACLMVASAVPAVFGECAASGLTTIGQSAADGRAKVKLRSTAIGGQIGARWQPSDAMTLGASYTLPVRHDFEGKVRHDPAAGAPGFLTALPVLTSGKAKSDATFPGSLQMGAQIRLAGGHDLALSVQRTYWSSVDHMVLKLPQNQRNSVHFGLRDSNRFALGANLDLGQGWRALGGVAYDYSPVRQAVRMPVLPDSDRRTLALGVRSPKFGGGVLTVGWMREFLDHSRVAQTGPVVGVAGRYRRVQVDTVGVAYSVEFDS